MIVQELIDALLKTNLAKPVTIHVTYWDNEYECERHINEVVTKLTVQSDRVIIEGEEV